MEEIELDEPDPGAYDRLCRDEDTEQKESPDA